MEESGIKFLRPVIRQMQGYVSARSIVANEIARTDASIVVANMEAKTAAPIVYLDANENPWGPENMLSLGDPFSSGGYNRYPEPQPVALLQSLSVLYSVSTDQLIVGRGMDEMIDVLLRAFCEPQRDSIIVCPPTYGVYEIFAAIAGVAIQKVPLNGQFDIDLLALKQAIKPSTKLIFLCSPNNPTGNCLTESKLRDLIDYCQDRAIVVMDEAYIEFSDRSSCSQLVSQVANLIVLRTLSKSWGLAGVRVGTAIVHPALKPYLKKVISPYPLSQPAVDVAMQVLDVEVRPKIIERTQLICINRKLLSDQVRQLSMVDQVFPSEANFLLVRLNSKFNASALVAYCTNEGIVLRDRSMDLGLTNCFRITIGSPSENQRLVQLLNQFQRQIG